MLTQSWQPANDTEEALLATLAEDASCDVYADWLEERGDVARAEFVRIHRELRALPPDDPQAIWLTHKLDILGRDIDPTWRGRIVPIERIVPDEPVTLPLPNPASVQTPSGPVRFTWPSQITWIPSVEVPLWIRIGSFAAGTLIAISIVLYWLGA